MRRTVKAFRKWGDEAALPAGKYFLTGIKGSRRGDVAKYRGQVAEHVSGTAVVVMRFNAPGIRAGFLTIVTTSALRAAKPQDIVAMRRLSRRGLPSERRREHGRQQDGEHCRSDESRSAAHVSILSHKYQAAPRGAK